MVDGGNFRVQEFDNEGEFVREFGSIGRQAGQFARPKGIGVDAEGNIYVVDTAFGNFQIFDPRGRLLLAVGSRASTPGPARFMLPSALPGGTCAATVWGIAAVGTAQKTFWPRLGHGFSVTLQVGQGWLAPDPSARN